MDTLDRLFSESKRIGIKKLGIIWHGGEPTLAGYDFFYEANEVLKRYFDKSDVKQSIQTNGTLIDENFVKLFELTKMKVGISLEPIREIHNNFRFFKNGDESFDKVLNAIDLLKYYKINYSTISVISDSFFGLEEKLYENLIEITEKANLNPYIRMGKNSKNFLFNIDKVIEIYKNLYEIWKNDDKRIVLNPFVEMTESLLCNRSNVCSLSCESCFSFLALDSLGDVYICNRLVNNNDFKLGNILETKLEEILRSDVIKNQYIHYKKIYQECNGCEFLDNCNGGCYSDSLTNSFSEKTPFCKLYKTLFSIIKKDLGDVVNG